MGQIHGYLAGNGPIGTVAYNIRSNFFSFLSAKISLNVFLQLPKDKIKGDFALKFTF